MAVKLNGFNYGKKDPSGYLKGGEPDTVKYIGYDQAKFNFSYLIFMDEIEKHGLSIFDADYGSALDKFVHTDMRRALYMLPLMFMKKWSVSVDFDLVSEYILSGVFPENIHSRMNLNAHKIQSNLVVVGGNVIAIDYFRKMRNDN